MENTTTPNSYSFRVTFASFKVPDIQLNEMSCWYCHICAPMYLGLVVLKSLGSLAEGCLISFSLSESLGLCEGGE